MWLPAESKQEFSKWKGCSKVGRGHKQTRTFFLLPLKKKITWSLYSSFFLPFPSVITRIWQNIWLWSFKKKCLFWTGCFLLLPPRKIHAKRKTNKSKHNPSCGSITAWEKSSFSPLSLETCFLYVHGDTCYISGRQPECCEAVKILLFWTTSQSIQGQIPLHLKEKGDSCFLVSPS